MKGSGFRVQGSGFKVQGAGFRVHGSGFRVQTLGVEATMGVFAPSAAGCAFVCESVGGRFQGVGFTGESRSQETAPPPSDHHMTLGIVLREGSRGGVFLMSEVPLKGLELRVSDLGFRAQGVGVRG